MGSRNGRMAEESTEEARFLLVEEKCQYRRRVLRVLLLKVWFLDQQSSSSITASLVRRAES